MAFDWKSYLTLAEDLAKSGDEAAKRTAISRAYYCVFNLAFARAGDCPLQEGLHQWCWNRYTNHGDPSCRRLGIQGDRMKKSRVHADYRPGEIRRLEEVVQGILQDARQFVGALQALPPYQP